MVGKIAAASGVALALVISLAATPGHPALAEEKPAAAERRPARGDGVLAPLSGGETIELPPTDERVTRPDAFLGYRPGARFTHWERIEAYFGALAASSPRVKIWEYGRTYEGRPLELVAITSPENLARLEEIRLARLRLADPASLTAGEREALEKRLPAVVWLAYGIHGNEASSSEAAMVVAYALAAGQGETAELLRRTIVLIDPLSNPDGRERYVHAYEQRQGGAPNSHRAAAEHWEPWPGGRQNHYLIDLNRDWAWATQQESRGRLAAYRAWEPQVYVDFHEMAADSTYFFPPAAEPVHPKIDRRVVGWLDTFGRANAEAFDRQGWMYYKSENYDLFYPGYGDSYPSLHGAIGMTYEMAGGARGGLALARSDGTVLTLADRIGRHVTTSLATFHTAARNSQALLREYVAGRARAGGEPVRSYLWPADQREARSLADLLSLHGVRVRQLAHAAEVAAQPTLGPREEKPRHFAAGTFVASTAQPLGNLVQALMDREAPMTQAFLERQRRRFEENREAEFYDITAWSLPLAFNLRVWVAAGEPAATKPLAAAAGGIEGSGELGYLVAPQGIASYRLEAELRRHGLRHRIAMAAFSEGGVDYPAGTLFVPRHGNPDGLPQLLAGLLRDNALSARALASSYELKGLSLGSNDMRAVRPVRLGLLSGQGVDPTSFGFLWFLLDRQVGMANDRLDVAHLRPADLAELDVLILPNGDYSESIGDKSRAALDAWIRAGGILVAVGGDTVKWLQGHELTAIKPWKAPAEEDEESEGSSEKLMAERAIATPGAVVATRMQAHHPLTLGIPAPPPVLVEGSAVMLPTGDPRQDVLVAAPENPVIAGFAWPEAKQRLAGSLLVGAEQRGNGGVVLFLHEPAFRLFWRATAPLLLNAVMYGSSTGLGGRG